MADLQLELYVAGQSPNSLAALDNLRRLCAHELVGRCDVRIVDILEEPGAAEAANILATPTLIKRAPPPLRRIIGDLSNTEIVLQGLDYEEWQQEGQGTDER